MSKINLMDIRFGQLFAIISHNRNMHKLFKYNVAVRRLSCSMVFIVIGTRKVGKLIWSNFIKCEMNTKKSKPKITDRLNIQLNIVQITHPQLSNNTFSFEQAMYNTRSNL